MDNRPFISVIMPIRNEADRIAQGLGAVLVQDYPQDRMEVFVVDGMSTDATRSIIADLATKHSDIPISVLDNPGRIVPIGMNIALAKAKGEIIVRVDGHCEIAPDYVSRSVDHLLSDKLDGVGGPIDTIGATPLSKAIAVAMSVPFGVGNSAFRTVKDKGMFVDTVAFPAYMRKAIDMAGPYDEELVRNQDDEYNYRLRSLGDKIYLAQDIHSKYYSRSSIKSLWRQYYQYGYWKVRVMQKHPAQMSLRQFAPPLLVTVIVGGAVLALFSSFFRALWLIAVVGYIVGNLAASWLTASKTEMQYFQWLPLIFATLHFSYGSSFVVGLVKFANRWQDKSTQHTNQP